MPERLKPFQGQAGVRLGHGVIDDLGAASLLTSPANYEIWAAYKTGANPDLTREISALLARGETLSDETCAALFESHFAKTRLSAQIVEASAEVAREIADVAVNLRDSGARAGAFAGELEDAATCLEHNADAAALRRTVARLAHTTKHMAAHNLQLEQKLQHSSRQLDALQVTMQNIRLQAVTDGLTGLANRRHFDDSLEAALAKASENAPLSLILGDIDRFKAVNDTWGHQVGDQVIRYVASVFKANEGAGLAARYGGEEFALILPGYSSATARDVAERIRRAIKAKSLSKRATGETIGVVTISLGLASAPPHQSPAALLEAADASLYQAKRNGRDQIGAPAQSAAA